MATIIEMPKLSDTMTTGTLVAWLKKEGDKVSSGDMIAEIETDKATMELESFDDGIILKRFAKEGDEVAIGDPVCAIGEEGEEVPDVGGSSGGSSAKEEKSEEKKEEKKAETQPEPKSEKKEEKSDEDDNSEVEAESDGKRVKASPLARKIAVDKGISLASIKGSGPNGRIVKADVLAAAEKGPSKSEKSESKAEAKTFVAPAGSAIAEDEDIPVSKMRSVIAKRLVESKQNLPHFYLEIEVDAAPLLELRAAVNANLAELPPEKGGIKLSVNDFILKASAEALRRVPAVNRSWNGDKIRQHGSVHLAFGVAIDDGLLTPVIRDAHAKGLRQIAGEAKELIGKARKRKLTPDEMAGSTFTVTNLGMYGVSNFYGIINPPNAAILSVGATIKKPVVDAKGNIVVGQRMMIGLSGDHRVIDGANGAEFLKALKDIVETPALMLV